MQLTADLSATAWPAGTNQVMLFSSPELSALPSYLDGLLRLLPDALEPLPSSLRDIILHSSRPRQVILNLYPPGTGISPHIDLPHRYLDGIVGCSFAGSVAMDFKHSSTGEQHSVLLKPGDIYVLSGEARWDWTHGISARSADVVQETLGSETYMLHRRMRMSVTFRRMQVGADCVGVDDTSSAGCCRNIA